MKKSIACFLLFAAVAMPVRTFAWGATGHKLVAKIAYNLLKPNVRDSVAKYLMDIDIVAAGIWMDEIKSDASYSYMNTWHYINMEKGQPYSPDSTNNIIWALKMVIGELQHRDTLTPQKASLDLKILVHLIGDLHQPMHTGYGSDRGGNSVTVFFMNATSNLHRVWDTDILEAEIAHAPTEWSNAAQFTKEEYADLRKLDLVRWLGESRSKLDNCYDFKGDNLNRKYAVKNVPLIEKQLLIGGIRLASVLNQLFK